MKFIRKYADNTSPGSVSNSFRRKRFAIFEALIKDLPKPVKVLDIGGTKNFWKQMGYLNSPDVDLTITNIEAEDLSGTKAKFFAADARNLSRFVDKEFDLVLSNSVIEHFSTFEEQMQMAYEVKRIGKIFYVQTPNYYFPFEPHYLFPCFQFLPMFLKIFLLKNFSLGWFEKTGSDKAAREIINSIRLLRKNELSKLFPDSKIKKEKFLLLTKSYIVIS